MIQRYVEKNGAVLGIVSGDDQRGWRFTPLCQEGKSRKRHPTQEAAVRRFMPGVILVCHAQGMKALPYC
jgi:hypothetical protein